MDTSGLNVSPRRGLSPVQFQKILFVFGRELRNEAGAGFYEFEPYHYGPFSADIYRDADSMSRQGLVAISSDGETRFYSATPAGRHRAAALIQVGPHHAIEYLHSVVNWAQSLTFSQLLKAVYAKYPEMSANSVFRG